MRLTVIFILCVSFSASAFTVKECIDGSRRFKISEDTLGRLIGEFKDFTGPVSSYGNCKKIARTGNYRCDSRERYVIYISKPGDKDVVQFNLKGDFGLDSGYLFSLYCD